MGPGTLPGSPSPGPRESKTCAKASASRPKSLVSAYSKALYLQQPPGLWQRQGITFTNSVKPFHRSREVGFIRIVKVLYRVRQLGVLPLDETGGL